jgi:hypothetical protein
MHRKLKNLSQLAAAYDPELAHHSKVTITDDRISQEQPAESGSSSTADSGADGQKKAEQKGPNAAEMVRGTSNSACSSSHGSCHCWLWRIVADEWCGHVLPAGHPLLPVSRPTHARPPTGAVQVGLPQCSAMQCFGQIETEGKRSMVWHSCP